MDRRANLDLKPNAEHLENVRTEQPAIESNSASSNEQNATAAAEHATSCQIGTSLQCDQSHVTGNDMFSSHVMDASGEVHHEACNNTAAGAHAISCQVDTPSQGEEASHVTGNDPCSSHMTESSGAAHNEPCIEARAGAHATSGQAQASLQAEQRRNDAVNASSIRDAPKAVHCGAGTSTIAGEWVTTSQIGAPVHDEQSSNKMSSDAPRSHASNAASAANREAGSEQTNASPTTVLNAACNHAQSSATSRGEVPLVGINAETIAKKNSSKDTSQALPAHLFFSDELLTAKEVQSELRVSSEDFPFMPPAACNIPQDGSEPVLDCTTWIHDKAGLGTQQPNTKVQLQVVEETEVSLLAGEVLVSPPALI